MDDVLIVGAGVAGLSCAQALGARGRGGRVIERSTRPGGRCSSKPVGESGPELDFGPVFVHGDSPEFVAWVQTLEGLVPGWPRVIVGTGTPCQPGAFDARHRWGLAGGLGVLGRSLAQALTVEYGTQATGWSWDPDGFTVETNQGPRRARHLVWALAPEQTDELLGAVEGERGRGAVARASALLGLFGSQPCLTVLARYAPGTPVPDWDLWQPETGPILLVSNEGSKRGGDEVLLTIQARPGWSSSHFEAPDWGAELLAAAGDLVPGASSPAAYTCHRWRYGRLGPADRLARPLVLTTEGSTGTLGITGELFDRRAGLEGAWWAGRTLGQALS